LLLAPFSCLSKVSEIEYQQWLNSVLHSSTIHVLGQTLYTYFAFFFLLAGLILLVAMIGAISLTLGGSGAASPKQQYSQRALSEAMFSLSS